MLNTSLRDKTLFLLQTRSIQLTFEKIAKDTGLSDRWLSMFCRGKITDPSSNKIQTLYEYLAKTKIKI